MYRSRYYQVFVLAGNDAMALSPLGGFAGDLYNYVDYERATRLYIHVSLISRVYLVLLRSFPRCSFDWDFSIEGASWGSFKGK